MHVSYDLHLHTHICKKVCCLSIKPLLAFVIGHSVNMEALALDLYGHIFKYILNIVNYPYFMMM